MKRQREDSDEEDTTKDIRKQLKSIEEIISRVVENSERAGKRSKNSFDFNEDDTETEDARSGGIFSTLTSFFTPAPKTTEALIAQAWGDKILNGEIKVERISYADAGKLYEYSFFINYPNYIDETHWLSLCANIPNFYMSFLDHKDCTPGRNRFVVQTCKSDRLKRLLNREQLKEVSESHASSMLNSTDVNINDESHRELDKRISKILSICENQPPDLPNASERFIKDSVIGVIHRNINPPVMNSDISKIIGTPLVHSIKFQPDKTRVGTRATLEIQKG
jgi:hypothetical protein